MLLTLKKRFKQKEVQLKKVFRQIKKQGLDEQVKQLHIEVFFSYAVDLMLYCMDDNLNEVFVEESKYFSGVKELITDLNIIDIEKSIKEEINNPEDKTICNELCKEIKLYSMYTLGKMLSKHIKKINIPVYLLIYGTEAAIDVKTGKTFNIYTNGEINKKETLRKRKNDLFLLFIDQTNQDQ